MKRIAIALAALALAAPAWGVKPKDTGMKAVKNGKVTERPVDKGYASINEMTARGHIGFLAADELEGREAGYNSGRIAGNYVEAYLRTLGLEPWNGTDYTQPFEAYRIERQKRGRYTVHPDSIAKLKPVVHQRLPLKNVMAKITGKNPDEIVMIAPTTTIWALIRCLTATKSTTAPTTTPQAYRQCSR